MTERLIDQRRIDELRHELPEADMAALVQLFLETTPELVAAVATAISLDQPDAAVRAAHRLKGGCLSIGAQALATASAQIEAGNELRTGVVDQLEATWHRTAAALRSLQP